MKQWCWFKQNSICNTSREFLNESQFFFPARGGDMNFCCPIKGKFDVGQIMRSRFLSLGLVQKEVMINKWDKIEAFIQMPRGQENTEKTVDDSWLQRTTWFSVLPILSGQANPREMISVHLWSWTRFRRPTLSAYKLLQLLRRLTGLAMMAADDIHWSWV